MSESKTQRLHRSYAEEVHARLESEFTPPTIPEGWHDIWREKDRRDEKRVRVTLALDADVVRFFKGLGAGYQPRMNRVLRAFMHDRLAGLVAGPEDRPSDVDLAELRRLTQELAARDADQP